MPICSSELVHEREPKEKYPGVKHLDIFLFVSIEASNLRHLRVGSNTWLRDFIDELVREEVL